ncbi:electron transport complex subunit RsxC [bacterium]|nr:electron transport complex subunit RsxC [bacterium]
MNARFFHTTPSFKHGVHPDDYKHLTRDRPIERLPFPDSVVVPISQHLGRPSKPIVSPGQYVYRGQLIGEATGFVSSPMHAPMSGVVREIMLHHHPSGNMTEAVVIDRDPLSAQTLFGERRIDWRSMSAKEIIDEIGIGGFVGLGGAAFPTHVKLTIPEGKKARFFIVNAAECEPYLNSDYRILLEKREAVFEGIRVYLKALGAERAYIGTESNKADAARFMREGIPSDLPCEVVEMETKYPQGAEKMLIEAVLHKEVPSGKLPIDVEVVVNNVGTVAGVGELFLFGQPLIERVVTITGPGIKTPANLMIPIGTRLSDVVAYCDGIMDNTRQILFGGPMMGTAQRFLDVPIMKGTSGVLFLTEDKVVHREEYPCIRCQRCVDACPVYLNPSRLGALAGARLYEDMLDYHIMDCMECAACSFVCPSNIPLVQRFRVAKGLLREQQARENEKQKAQS